MKMNIASVVNNTAALILSSCCLAAPAFAGETAYTVRDTEVKQKPFSDAPTVATLSENTAIDVLSRNSGWVEIRSNSGRGWVRMLSLRNRNTAEKPGDSGLQSLLNAARSGSSGVTVATGVRGLSEEDLKNATPNPRELEKLQRYAESKNKAEEFARNAKLKTRPVEYLPTDSEGK